MPLPASVALEEICSTEIAGDFNHFFNESLCEVTGTLARAWQHHINSGGSRLRANIAISVAKEAGLSQDIQYRIAAATEILHQSSLLLDDIQDRDGFRRGKPSIWKEYGEGVAINLSLILITKAYRLISDVERSEGLKNDLGDIISGSISKTVFGQQADLENSKSTILFDRYEEICGAKSGTLFALPFLIVMSLQGETEETLALCEEIAALFGLAYQLVDDHEDRYSDNLKLDGLNTATPYQFKRMEHKSSLAELLEQVFSKIDILFKKLPDYTQGGQKLFKNHILKRIEEHSKS